jgi:spore coat polysaccharide biosynthesis predicted glycosyltransferase SpsG
MGRGFDEISGWCQANGVAVPMARWRSAIEPVLPAAYDVVVVDHYGLPAEWIASAARVRPTFLIDDWMRREATVTGFINPNVGARRDDYPNVQARAWCLGPQFALLRREIRETSASPVNGAAPARRLLVTLGGSDPDGWTAQIAEEVLQLPWCEEGGEVTVVLGASYAGAEPWAEWPAEQRRRLEVVRQPRDFAQRCAQADVVVSGAGTTTYELAYLGRPFVPVALVDNQARITQEWYRMGVGLGIAVWDRSWRLRLREAVTDLLTSPGTRAVASARVAAIVDGRGVERFLDMCTEAHRVSQERMVK